MRFIPDGSTLAVGLAQGVKLWDLAARRTLSTLEGHRDWVTSVAFSPDGASLASASEYGGTIRLWDVATGNAVALEDHAYRVTSLRFSPDGDMLAVGSGDVVKLRNTVTGTTSRVLAEEGRWWTAGAFSPDGGSFAVGVGSSVRLWDLRGDTPSTVLWEGEHRVTSVSFSPDGTLLVSGTYSGEVRLWDVLTGTHLGTLEGPGIVTSVSFSPDGRSLASGGEHGTTLLWDLQLLLPHPQALTKVSGDYHRSSPSLIRDRAHTFIGLSL